VTRPATVGRLRRTRVTAKRWITPRIVRITVGGDLHDFRDQGTDQHVALYLYPPEAIVPDDLSLDGISELHEFAHPQMRRYTIRRWDPRRQEVDFDFVVHEPAGVASVWARDADVGDELLWWGPTPAWTAPKAGTLAMIGDETALPAIDAVIAELDPEVRALVVAEIADERDETYLARHRDRAEVTWIRRGEPTGEVVEDLALAVRSLDLEPGPAAVWAGAEFKTAGFLRRWFIGQRAMTKENAFIVSYWIYGQAQDQRADERDRAKNLRNRRLRPDVAARHVREEALPSVDGQAEK